MDVRGSSMNKKKNIAEYLIFMNLPPQPTQP